MNNWTSEYVLHYSVMVITEGHHIIYKIQVFLTHEKSLFCKIPTGTKQNCSSAQSVPYHLQVILVLMSTRNTCTRTRRRWASQRGGRPSTRGAPAWGGWCGAWRGGAGWRSDAHTWCAGNQDRIGRRTPSEIITIRLYLLI